MIQEINMGLFDNTEKEMEKVHKETFRLLGQKLPLIWALLLTKEVVSIVFKVIYTHVLHKRILAMGPLPTSVLIVNIILILAGGAYGILIFKLNRFDDGFSKSGVFAIISAISGFLITALRLDTLLMTLAIPYFFSALSIVYFANAMILPLKDLNNKFAKRWHLLEIVYGVGVACSAMMFSDTLFILGAFLVNTICSIWHIILLGITAIMLNRFNKAKSSIE